MIVFAIMSPIGVGKDCYCSLIWFLFQPTTNIDTIPMLLNFQHMFFSGIGIIITSNADQGSAYFLSVATLQALAGGTIIYVVVFEVLERERSKNVSGLAQLFFVILGFCVMMSVEILGKVLNIIILF